MADGMLIPNGKIRSWVIDIFASTNREGNKKRESGLIPESMY